MSYGYSAIQYWADEAWAAQARVQELEAEVVRLTGERDRARDLAVRSGVFLDSGGSAYALTEEEL